ncbi:MAG TPA: hypothetical protein DCQ34_02090 [Chitinophagaceae bacterium]|nr:hypothetical protein [Chitinophagaceae bacterium]
MIYNKQAIIYENSKYFYNGSECCKREDLQQPATSMIPDASEPFINCGCYQCIASFKLVNNHKNKN